MVGRPPTPDSQGAPPWGRALAAEGDASGGVPLPVLHPDQREPRRVVEAADESVDLVQRDCGRPLGQGVAVAGFEPAVGAYAAWTYSRNENAAATEAKLREVLRTFHAGGITEEERADAAGYLRGRRAFTVQSPGQVLDRVLWDLSRGLEAGDRDALSERAATLPLDEVNAFIRRFYDPPRFTLVRVETK